MSPRALLSFLTFMAFVPAQSLTGTLDLNDFDPLNRPDYSFGVTADRDGRHVYVAVSGNYGASIQNNRRLLKIDALARVIVAEALVGLFPEDVIVTYDGSGVARHVFVTCSSSSTVEVLTPSLLAVATIPIPSCAPFNTAFPFGLVASEDGSRILVTTLAGCGDAFVVGADPQAPGFATILETRFIPGGHGRPSRVGTSVIVPTSVLASNGALSQAAIAEVEFAPGGALTRWLIFTPVVAGTYVAAIDSAATPAGRVLVTTNGDPSSQLYEYDPATGSIVRTIPLGISAGFAVHGLGLSPDGRVAVVTSQDSDSLLIVDTGSGTLIGTIGTGANTQPNEVAFLPDGSTFVATLQTNSNLLFYDQVPLRSLDLVSPSSVPLGGNAGFALSGGDYGVTSALFISAAAGPTLVLNVVISLAEPFYLLASGLGEASGTLNLSIPVPSAPATLSGLLFWLQAATIDRDGTFRISNLDSITLN